MGKNLMKSNQISAGRTQNSGFGHKSEMELILCFITCLKNKKRAPYAWECWTDWSDVHRLPALVSRRTDGFKISPCPPGGRNAHSSTDDSVFLWFFFCLFFCLYHNTQHGKVMHKGPGEKGNREGDVLGFPGATECREDEEEHFGRHSWETEVSQLRAIPEQVRLFICGLLVETPKTLQSQGWNMGTVNISCWFSLVRTVSVLCLFSN